MIKFHVTKRRADPTVERKESESIHAKPIYSDRFPIVAPKFREITRPGMNSEDDITFVSWKLVCDIRSVLDAT